MRPDEQIVNSVLTGDRRAYAELVVRYERAVHTIAFAALRDHHAAQDAAQDTFVTAYQKLSSLRDSKSFGSWILTIARHTAIDRARLHLHLVPSQPLLDDHPAPIPATSGDRTAGILDAVARLPEHERRTILLRYFEGRSVAEIASMTGRSVGTITKQLSRALQRLRNASRRIHHER